MLSLFKHNSKRSQIDVTPENKPAEIDNTKPTKAIQQYNGFERSEPSHPDYLGTLFEPIGEVLNNAFKDAFAPLNTVWDNSLGFDFYSGSDGSVNIAVEMPGVKKENLSVEIVGKTINVKGDRIGMVNKTYIRSFPITDTYDPDSLTAELKDGLLTLTLKPLPITEPVEPKKIKVEVKE